MDDNIFFKKLINILKETVSKELALHSDFYSQNVIINTENCYRVIIEWTKCMGEIVIEKPVFAPYRYVSFTIQSCTDKENQFLFCWYDSPDDSLDTVRKKITEGINIGFNY